MQSPTLLTLGSEAPIIDVDSTLALQFVLFVVMALVATKWLFRPYLAMRDERRAGIEGARLDAEQLSAQADASLANYEDKLAAARARAAAEQRKIRAEAVTHEAEVTSRARSEATTAVADARVTVRTEITAARGELLPKADELARQMASKLLGREVA
ncbi:MAG TPA: ATP synthase F0 subunit B [Kofleriaceae bacterium]|nr:ATP synthase F0 subunit B [Kofleriaceae bacterium]